MANSVFKCSGCKKYFKVSERYYQHGPQSFHSEACLQEYQNRKPAESRGRTHSSATDIPPAIRAIVLERDRNRCRYCNTRSRLHLHHIVYRGMGGGTGKHTPDNLITLCNDHHDLMHSDKKKYQPLCQGVIWLYYTTGKMITIPQYQRWIDRMKREEGE